MWLILRECWMIFELNLPLLNALVYFFRLISINLPVSSIQMISQSLQCMAYIIPVNLENTFKFMITVKGAQFINCLKRNISHVEFSNCWTFIRNAIIIWNANKRTWCTMCKRGRRSSIFKVILKISEHDF